MPGNDVNEGTAGQDRAPSPAVARALTVLETLVESDEGMTLTALAKRTNIPLATCASIVYTLEQRGYAQRRVVGRSHFWRPTLRLYGLATQLVRKVDLSSVAQRELRELADVVGMPVHIGVLTGASVVYVAKAATPGFIQFDTYPGKVAPFNLTALGKAIAAHLPERDLEPLLTQLTPGRGPRAAEPTREAFLSELAGVRKRGYAVEDEEEQAEIACVAAPFFDAGGLVGGAVGVTGFSRDLAGQRRKEAIAGVVEIGRTVSRKLGFDDLR
ncbi:IclR family transcriptional regulator [Jiangella alkaliphila]|uniref:DNA-binding transcriptional regulator, IclR family n=1 Tax=Jiangella alkaliphila TaxID=419479 RepID=A0A1H2LL95_9ACTN|nr:IclR family transcriptional regulator [Jiangella alkaliphila]SDU81783.1 DNA-binding transcriptional regulator, IclR family [Jiangella alkaliphila]